MGSNVRKENREKVNWNYSSGKVAQDAHLEEVDAFEGEYAGPFELEEPEDQLGEIGEIEQFCWE